MAATREAPAQVFTDISVDDENTAPMEIESVCMNCFKNGTTTLLFTRIPFFREVVLMAFECPHCGCRNNQIQPAAMIAEMGSHYELTVHAGDVAAVQRQVVKAESATLSIPELDFEIPASTQKGTMSTVEGMLLTAAENLGQLQEERRVQDPATAAAIDSCIARLSACARAEESFTVVLDDPAGNSIIESNCNPKDDQLLTVRHYDRSREQQEALGLKVEDLPGGANYTPSLEKDIDPADPHHGFKAEGAAILHKALARIEGPESASMWERYSRPEDVLVLPGRCCCCSAPSETRMFKTHIPFFKEVIVMANSCDSCGYNDFDIKSAGAISDHGIEVILKVEEPEDLRRDVIKGEAAKVIVPEIGLEVDTVSLGGVITTVEGLLLKVKTNLMPAASFHLGDSAAPDQRSAWKEFVTGLDDCVSLNRKWTLILRDPLANTFVAPLTEDPSQDPRLVMRNYERSAEEDEEYGISHLKELAQQEERERAEALQEAAQGDAEAPAAPPLGLAEGHEAVVAELEKLGL